MSLKIMRANYKLQRLYVCASLEASQEISISEQQAHYLVHVLRMKEGAQFLVFNGQDGEYLAEICAIKKKYILARLLHQERAQSSPSDIIYCFAPLKHARLDYMIQKAVEMGASIMQPVMTRHTQVTRLNLERLEANGIEAAEQCGILNIPKFKPLITLEQLLIDWESNRHLIFCDENAKTNNPLFILQNLPKKPIGVLIGPEGGFSEEERNLLIKQDFVTSIPLGPHILRADTAAVAALAIIGATLGGWDNQS